GRPFLHFRVGTLYRIEFDRGTEISGIRTGNRGSPHSDTVVVTAQDHYAVPGFWDVFQGLVRLAIANATGQHDDLVKAQLSLLFPMLKGQHRTCDQGLAELVSK